MSTTALSWKWRGSATDDHASIPVSDGSWATTTRLNDNAAGDTLTDQHRTVTQTVSTTRRVDTAIMGLITLCGLPAITAYDFTFNFNGTFNGDPIVGNTLTWLLCGSTDGTAWTTFATGTTTATTPVRVQNTGSYGSYTYVQVVVSATQGGTPGDVVIWTIGLSDFSVNGVRSTGTCANEIPQCTTRTFTAAGSVTPKSGFLWEIQNPSGVVIDYGTRYDRFGLNGWGVLLPGLTGSGSISVSAPGNAIIAAGYLAVAGTGSASLSFDVIAGSGCPGTGSISMAQNHIFSTGALYVAPRLSPDVPTLTRVNIGSPPSPSGALANAFDASPATTVDTTYTNSSNRSYLRCDFLASVAMGWVILRNVTCTASIAVYASDSAITDGNFASATQLTVTGTNPPTNNALLALPASGTTVTKRYLYIVCATAGFTVGDIDIRGERIQVGYIQNASAVWQYGIAAEIRDSCYLNMHPVADAQGDLTVTFQAETAVFSPKQVVLLTGSTRADDGTNPITLTGGLTDKPLAFCAEYTTQTVEGKNAVFTFYELKAPGVVAAFKRGDFAMPSFTAALRFSDTSALPWRIEVDQ